MQKSIHTLAGEIKEDLNTIIDAKLSLYKIKAYEKGIPAGLKLVYNLVIVVLSLFLLGILLTSGALALSTLFVEVETHVLSAVSMGFLIVGGVLALMILALILLRAKFVHYGYNSIIEKVLDESEEPTREEATHPRSNLSPEMMTPQETLRS